MASIKAILFDHDGTLVDSESMHFQMWVSILKPYGVNLTEEDYIHDYAGIPTSANAILLVDKYRLSVSSDELKRLKDQATEDFLSRQAFPLVSGALEVITHFAQSPIRLAIVTGASGGAPRATLAENGLEDCFDTVVSSDDVTLSKPAPDSYLLAATRLGVEPEDCIAIEDTQNGVKAAVAANIPCVAIVTKMSKHHDLSEATHVVSSLKEAGDWSQKTYF